MGSRKRANEDLASGQISPDRTSSPVCTRAALPQSRRTARAPNASISSGGTRLQKYPTHGRSAGPAGRVFSVDSNQAMSGGRRAMRARLCAAWCSMTRARRWTPGLSVRTGGSLKRASNWDVSFIRFQVSGFGCQEGGVASRTGLTHRCCHKRGVIQQSATGVPLRESFFQGSFPVHSTSGCIPGNGL